MRKGSREAKAWGRKMKRLREKPKLNAEKEKDQLEKDNVEKLPVGHMLDLKRRRTRRKKSESAWSW